MGESSTYSVSNNVGNLCICGDTSKSCTCVNRIKREEGVNATNVCRSLNEEKMNFDDVERREETNVKLVDEWSNCGDDKTYKYGNGSMLKMLVSHLVAGGIIGRNGEEITSLQASYQVQIKLSASREYFPGTQDRVVLLTGCEEAVIAASRCIIMKLRDEALHNAWENGCTQINNSNVQINLKMVVPKSSVGVLIGKSGCQVKVLQESTGCRIYILKDNFESTRLKERICLIWGNEEQVQDATKQIFTMLQANCKNSFSDTVCYYPILSLPFVDEGCNQTNNATTSPLPLQSLVVSSAFEKSIFNFSFILYHRPELLEFFNTIDIQIPASSAGSIIGSNGRTVSEIQKHTGTSIQISAKEKCDEYTDNRKLTISGPLYGVLEAYVAIIDKLQRAQHKYIKGDVTVNMHGRFRDGTRTTTGGDKAVSNYYGYHMRGMGDDASGYSASDKQFHLSLNSPISYYGGQHHVTHYSGVHTMVGGRYVEHSDSASMGLRSPDSYLVEYVQDQGVPCWSV